MSLIRPFILVIGCGSIGERHLRTFLATGRADVVACDNRAEIRAQMTSRYQVTTIDTWQEALAGKQIDAVVIATPAPLHVDMALQCLQAGKHVLIEKPLSTTWDGIESLISARNRSGKFVGVGYVLHFVPALQAARRWLESGAFGSVRQVTVTSAHHFPTSRPAYREIYYRDRAQGGGAIQDALTHLVNVVEWMLGQPTSQVFCDADHRVLEGVTVEDTVNATARNGSVMVSYSLNQFGSANETRWDFHLDTGSVRVELHAQRWGTLALGESAWTWFPLPLAARDDMYIAQAHAFLDGCEGRNTLLCSLDEGAQTLRFNLAALQSSTTGVRQFL